MERYDFWKGNALFPDIVRETAILELDDAGKATAYTFDAAAGRFVRLDASDAKSDAAVAAVKSRPEIQRHRVATLWQSPYL